MALKRLHPYSVGEIIRLRSHGRGDQVFVVSPSGIEIRMPAPRGTVELWLAEAGTWTAQWQLGEVEVIEVAEPVVVAEVEETPPVPRSASRLSTTRA